jgi:hypothetical protein
MRFREATASLFVANIRGEILEHFYAVVINVTVVSGIDCLACKEEFFMNNPHM